MIMFCALSNMAHDARNGVRLSRKAFQSESPSAGDRDQLNKTTSNLTKHLLCCFYTCCIWSTPRCSALGCGILLEGRQGCLTFSCSFTAKAFHKTKERHKMHLCWHLFSSGISSKTLVAIWGKGWGDKWYLFCFLLPFLVKNSLEYFPAKMSLRGIFPRSSMINAIWSACEK